MVDYKFKSFAGFASPFYLEESYSIELVMFDGGVYPIVTYYLPTCEIFQRLQYSRRKL